MESWLKYVEVGRINLRAQWVYVWDQLLSGFHLIVLIFIFYRLWSVTFASNAAVGDYTLPEMVWYILGTETIILSLPRIHSVLDAEVRSGDLALRLNKPYEYLLFHYSALLGEGLVRLVTTLLLGGVTAYLLVGGFSFQWQAIPALLLIYLLTQALHFCYNGMIGLTAFWTEDSAGVYFVMDRLKWIMGGFLLPIDLFPERLRPIAEALPFRDMIYAPARLFVKFSAAEFGILLMRQSAWVLLFGALIWSVYRLGVRKVDVNGG